MGADTYEATAFREWLGRVSEICKREFGRDVYSLPVSVSFGEAFEEGATPEEFVEADLRPSLLQSSQSVNHGDQ